MEYKVMPDIREKEKIVGGIFTITQTVPLALAVICGGLSGVGVFNLTGSPVLAIVTIILVAIPFLPFAFIKIEKMGNMELFFYLKVLLEYKNKQKVFVNINENQKRRLINEINEK